MSKIKKHIDIISLVVVLVAALIIGFNMPSYRASRALSVDESNYRYFLELTAVNYNIGYGETFRVKNLTNRELLNLTVEITTNGETYEFTLDHLGASKSENLYVRFSNHPTTYDYNRYQFTARGDISYG